MVDLHRSPSNAVASKLTHLHGRTGLAPQKGPTESVAAIYNQAGDDYLAYADGDPTQLFAFEGPHAYADRCVWALLDAKLTALRATGTSSVTFLDAGCGPGTWLRRLVTRAQALGFTSISARGFDIAQAQIQRARLLARNFSTIPGVHITFEVASITSRLPERDASVDISLCLYSVLSHLPVASMPEIAKEIARVTSGHFITAVRSIGSTPTAFVDSIEKVRQLKQDNVRDRCEIELCDGRHMAVSFHLFTARELRGYFGTRFDIEDMRGLDMFHSRFAPDPRWNPAGMQVDGQLSNELAQLEETYATRPEFMDRAAHLLLVARSRGAAAPSAAAVVPSFRRVSAKAR